MARAARTRPSLRTHVLYWLAGYALVLAVALSLHGFLVNEYAERLLWDSLVKTEFEHYLQRHARDPGYLWHDTESLKLHVDGSGRSPPSYFDGLSDGIHDEVVLGDGTELLVLVRHVDGVRHVLSLDITELEREEDRLTVFVFGSAILLTVLMAVLMALSLRRTLRPLADVAQAISALSPDPGGQRIAIADAASSELAIIAGALNDYLARNARFVERERAFIHSASHELRTPVAVVTGAVELALERQAEPELVRHQLLRIRGVADDMAQLIVLMLALAKDPARLASASEAVALDRLLPQIVEDHLHLTRGKALTVRLAPPPPCVVLAPAGIVRAAIGNLLRNAIEHSDGGRIDLRLEADATVVIEDPGHGMTPEQISAVYSRLARGGVDEGGGGIGLDLIARLCEHLGWRLDIRSGPERGTTATLRMRGG